MESQKVLKRRPRVTKTVDNTLDYSFRTNIQVAFQRVICCNKSSEQASSSLSLSLRISGSSCNGDNAMETSSSGPLGGKIQALFLSRTDFLSFSGNL